MSREEFAAEREVLKLFDVEEARAELAILIGSITDEHLRSHAQAALDALTPSEESAPLADSYLAQWIGSREAARAAGLPVEPMGVFTDAERAEIDRELSEAMRARRAATTDAMSLPIGGTDPAPPWTPPDGQPADSLDAAWAEAEAALPEGWGVQIIPGQPERWEATPIRDIPNRRGGRSGRGSTPAAALHALAARLRDGT